jgi:hypothetical protein
MDEDFTFVQEISTIHDLRHISEYLSKKSRNVDPAAL